MGDAKSATAKAELLALHAALVRQRKEKEILMQRIPVAEWNRILAQTLGVMTRQTASDKTWALEALGLLENEPGKGVVILDNQHLLVPA